MQNLISLVVSEQTQMRPLVEEVELEELQAVLKACWAHNPAERLSADLVFRELQHIHVGTNKPTEGLGLRKKLGIKKLVRCSGYRNIKRLRILRFSEKLGLKIWV